MKTRTLTRKVIIREYDFNKIKDSALETGYYVDNMALYDRVSFTPLNQEELEKLKIIDILKGKHSTPIMEAIWEVKFPATLLYGLRDYLYDERYYRWDVTHDEEGYICVQSRKNNPKSRIGWAVFEKELTCRI